MGALLWLAKMLLKVMKPFLSIALMESIKDALEQYLGKIIEDEFGSDEEETTVID